MKTGFLLLATWCLMVGSVMGEEKDWRSAFESKVFEKGGQKLPYRLATLGEGEKLPLVVFLHGAGERGDDNEAQIKHGMKDLPLWVFHGGKDKVVPAKLSEEIVAAVKAAGGEAKHRVYPEAGHNSWAATYSDEAVWKWMFSQVRKDG